MILAAFLAGAAVFLVGILTGVTITTSNYDRILNNKDI